MLNDFTRGAGYLFTGFKLIRQPRLIRYALIPLLINLLVFSLLISLAGNYFGDFIDTLLPAWLDYPFIRYLLWVIFAVLALVLAFYSFSLIANLIAAPFNDLLAEKVARKLGVINQTQTGALRGAFGAIRSQAQKLLYLLLWSLPFLLLLWIPLVNLLSTSLWFAFSAWLLALEYLDYPLGQRGLSFKTQRQTARQHFWLVFGFGCATLGLIAVPLLNLLVMPAAVAGATALAAERLALADSSR